VRKSADGSKLEIGFVNAVEYLKWLNGKVSQPPPTIFNSGEPKQVKGSERQADLGMVDKEALLKESREGTR
jgi:hypothetical protein